MNASAIHCLVFLALLIVALFSWIALHDASRERHERNRKALIDACRRSAKEKETVSR